MATPPSGADSKSIETTMVSVEGKYVGALAASLRIFEINSHNIINYFIFSYVG